MSAPSKPMRTFKGADARAALAAVRDAFGPDAVIISTRHISGGWFRRAHVEVTAAPVSPAPVRMPTAPPPLRTPRGPAPVPGLGASSAAPAIPRAIAPLLSPQIPPSSPLSSTAPAPRPLFPQAPPAAGSLPRQSPPLSALSRLVPADHAAPASRPPAREDRLVDDAGPYTPPPSIVDAVEPRGTPAAGTPVAAAAEEPVVLKSRRTATSSLPPPRAGARSGELVVVGPVLDEDGPGRGGMAVVTLGDDEERTSASIRRGRQWRRGGPADRLFRRYVHHGVDDIVAAELVQGAHVSGAREEAALDQVVRRLGASRLASTDAPWVPEPRGGRRVVALVGPTGVGKTTTLAKLAAKAILASRAKVALVTIDTYRICASDQLARYGQIMRAPTFVARDAAQLRSALDGTRDCDIVFVDSAGRSVQSELEAQIQMLRSATELRMYLTLSLASGDRELAFNCKRYAFLEPERVILTKFDEAVAPGAALAPLIRLGRPVTCVTNGQEVPEHIRAVDSTELMDVLLGPAVEAPGAEQPAPQQNAGRA